MFPPGYDPETGQFMKNLYNGLSEKDRRRYAAVEEKIGYGGFVYIATLFGCQQIRGHKI